MEEGGVGRGGLGGGTTESKYCVEAYYLSLHRKNYIRPWKQNPYFLVTSLTENTCHFMFYLTRVQRSPQMCSTASYFVVLFATGSVHWNPHWNSWNIIYQHLSIWLVKEQPLSVMVGVSNRTVLKACNLSARLGLGLRSVTYIKFVVEQAVTVSQKTIHWIDQVMAEAQVAN